MLRIAGQCKEGSIHLADRMMRERGVGHEDTTLRRLNNLGFQEVLTLESKNTPEGETQEKQHS
jgi:hypothetical protein